MTTSYPRLLRKWRRGRKTALRLARKARRAQCCAPATPMRLFAVVCCLWRTIACGMSAIKPSNKPLHLTAARSPARRPSRLARRGLRPLRSRQTGARGQVSGSGVRRIVARAMRSRRESTTCHISRIHVLPSPSGNVRVRDDIAPRPLANNPFARTAPILHDSVSTLDIGNQFWGARRQTMKKTRGTRMAAAKRRAAKMPGGKGRIRNRPAGRRIMKT
jgi:hypothetical protein